MTGKIGDPSETVVTEEVTASASGALHDSIAPFAIFLITSAIYFLTRSPGLDEFDSVNFAFGLRQFNLWQHQPHPPGYPLFIFFGWSIQKLFGTSPEISLHLVSGFGGGLFVAAWFLIIRLQFNERLAWWTAICLTITPIVWMTATKVLSDTLSSAFLSFEIFAALYFLERRSSSALLATAAFGAAATGARPQSILVVVLIFVIALKRGRAGRKMSILSSSMFVAGCLAWLLPTWYLQARLQPNVPAWLAYPELLYGQWQWRLDNPYAFIGAGKWNLHYLTVRFAEHFLGWFGLGFGFIQSAPVLVIGIAFVVFGLAVYMRSLQSVDRQFWKFHAPWALLHIAIIFVALGGKQRYYLVIFPLLLVAILRGVLQMARPWNRIALLFPALLLYVTVPAAIQNHHEESPPIRLVRYLNQLYPPSQRPNVALLFMNARRNAEWYAPEFTIFQDPPPPADLPNLLASATAIYTDDARVALPNGWHRVPLAVFQRSVIIHTKQHFLTLFLVDRHS